MNLFNLLRSMAIILIGITVGRTGADAQRQPLGRKAPPGPASVTAAGGPQGVLVSWTAVPGANGYVVLRSPDGVTFGPITAASPATSYLDPGVAAGSTVHYQVAAVYPNGTQGASASISYVALAQVAAGGTAVTPPIAGGAKASSAQASTATVSPGAVARASNIPASISTRGQPAAGATLQPLAPGPAPLNLRPLASTPVAHAIGWDQVPGATGYSVARLEGRANGRWQVVTAAPITQLQWTDRVWLDPTDTHLYRVTAVQASGSSGSAELAYTPPPMQMPAGLVGRSKSAGVVELTWQAVAGASGYHIFGPGIAAAGVVTTGISYSVPNVPPGRQTFSVTTDYNGVFALAGMTQTTVAVTTNTGNYRITLNGIRVDNETSEDLLSQDGKGDEVYASAFIQVLDRNTKTLLRPAQILKTAVHGDANNFSGRIQTGSGSPSGGIRTGDRIPANTHPGLGSTGTAGGITFPFTLFEGPLTDGAEAIIIRPVVWEYDGGPQAYDTWSNRLQSSTLAQTLALPGVIPAFTALGPTVVRGVGIYGVVALKGKMDALETFAADFGPGGDRPIGIAPVYLNPYWLDLLVVITREEIEAELSSKYVSGTPGIIAIPLVDNNSHGNLPYNGNYTLFVRIERLP